jgi:hypothetical protein
MDFLRHTAGTAGACGITGAAGYVGPSECADVCRRADICCAALGTPTVCSYGDASSAATVQNAANMRPHTKWSLWVGSTITPLVESCPWP